MRRLYIHIGTHKTGTTSLQWYLGRHARTLKGYGYYVPSTGRLSRHFAGHHNVAWAALGDARAQPAFGDVDALLAELEASRAVQAVISSEDFELLADRPRELRRFEERLTAAGWTPIYLMFLRSPGSYTLSMFDELNKNGNSVHFGSFFDQVLSRGIYRTGGDYVLHVDYDLFVAKWRAAARGELRIRSYDVASSGRGVVPEFIAAIDAPARLGELRQKLHNARTSPITDQMKAVAQRIEVKYLPAFMRQTGVHY